MKKFIKISFIIISILILNFLLIINSVTAAKLKNTNMIYGGDCGSLLRYKGIIVKVPYVEYQAEDKKYPAYCLDKTKQGIDENIRYTVSINDTIKDVKLWRYIINGYPYKTIEELGCANKEEAYTATKQAIYCYIHGNKVEDYEPIGEAGIRTLNALKSIVNNGNNSQEEMISNKITVKKEEKLFKQDSKELEYVSKTYSISTIGQIEDYIVSIQNGNNELIEGIKITDTNNNERNEFKQNEKFKILIPIKYLNRSGDFKIHIQTKIKTKPILYATAESASYQDYALTTATYEESIEDIYDEYSENYTKIKIIKQDKETGEKLSDVGFQLLNEKKEIIYANLVTNEKGEIEINHLLPGIYYLKETKVKNGYLENNELIKIDIKYNETLTVKINNLKEEEPEIETSENEISNTIEQKEIKKLPVTGM